MSKNSESASCCRFSCDSASGYKSHSFKLILVSVLLAGCLTGCLANMEERHYEEPKSASEVELTVLAPIDEQKILPEIKDIQDTVIPVSTEVEMEYTIYNVDLSVELQKYTQDLCKEYGVSYPLAIAIMYHESRFTPNVVSATDDYGIMQINKCNHAWLEEELGITDWFDPYQNIKAGVYILSLNSQYGDLHKVVMSYNYGPTGAKKCWDKGIYSSEYSRMVMNTIDNLEVV